MSLPNGVPQWSSWEDSSIYKFVPTDKYLQQDYAWIWGPAQAKAFEEIKTALMTMPVLALYDPNKETKVIADASS